MPGLTRSASRRAVGRDTSDLAVGDGAGAGCTMPTVPHRRAATMTVVTGTKPHPIFLAGRWVESPGRARSSTTRPTRRRPPARPTTRREAQYEEAVEAAVAAFEVTRTLPAYERGRILREISAGIKARREELGRLIALEAGKPIRDALVEVDRADADLPARRRGGRADDRRGHPARPDAVVEGPGRHHPALPDRPDRGHQPVQLPAQPGRPQALAGDRQRATRSCSSRRPRTRSRCSPWPRSSRRRASRPARSRSCR